MRLLLARPLLVQFVMVVSASFSSSLPTIFTQVQDRNCRFRFTIDTTLEQCFTRRCWMNSNVFRETDLVEPRPLQREACILEVPSIAYQFLLYAPLERIGLTSPYCSWEVLQHHTSIYKILANSSRINIENYTSLYQFKVGVGNPSDLWCESPNLTPVPDPYSGRCSIVITIPNFHTRYTGTWQMVVSLPRASPTTTSSTEAPAEAANALAELDSVHEFYVKAIDWPCNVCFGPQSKCAKLNLDDFYLSGPVAVETKIKRPKFSVSQGESFCAVLESATDTNGSWLFASNSTSMTAEPLLFFGAQEDGTIVSANTMNGVSLYGKYQHCLHIDQMTDALDGLFMYQHSSDYAATHTVSGLTIIRVQVDVDVLKKPEDSRTVEYASIGIAFATLLFTILFIAVRMQCQLKKLEQRQQSHGGSSEDGARSREDTALRTRHTDEEGDKEHLVTA